MSGPLRGRVLFLLAVAVLGWLALLGRGVYLTLIRHEHYSALAAQQHAAEDTIPGVRGPIYDCQGRVLACTMENPSLAVRLGASRQPRQLIPKLLDAGVCCQTVADRLWASVQNPPPFQWVQRRWLTSQQVDAIAGTDPAIVLRSELKRFYPAGSLGPQLLGVTGIDGHGQSGLERAYDDRLSGRPGRILRFQTGGGLTQNAPPERVLEEPDQGWGLVLTLDAHLQSIVRHRLREGLRQCGATEGSVILLDPRTGEILALCEEPSFDLLHDPVRTAEQLRFRSLQDQYEPGSTFKIVTFAAAFEHGVVSPQDSLACGNGRRILAGGSIRDHRPFGTVTITEAFSHSSNIGAGRIAEQLGWARLYETAQALGFGMTTGLGLEGEAAGSLPNPMGDRWSQRSLITIAYGQEVACTALQMAMATAAIANDGVLMRPYAVSALVDGEGRCRERIQPHAVRRALSSETAQTMRGLLREVVASGTGKGAELDWFPPAGKTGTAQIFDPSTGAYLADEHILSFSGFAPYDDPQILCQVILRCPGDLHASEAAVPVFGAILRDIAWMLAERRHPIVLSTDAAGRITVPDVSGLSPLAARRAIQRVGLLPVLDGLGDQVIEMRPPAHRTVSAATPIRLQLAAGAEEGRVAMPDVRGLSLRRAVAVLSEAGFGVGVCGAGWVIRQDPVPGSQVAPGSLCTTWASADASSARRDALRREEVACETR